MTTQHWKLWWDSFCQHTTLSLLISLLSYPRMTWYAGPSPLLVSKAWIPISIHSPYIGNGIAKAGEENTNKIKVVRWLGYGHIRWSSRHSPWWGRTGPGLEQATHSFHEGETTYKATRPRYIYLIRSTATGRLKNLGSTIRFHTPIRRFECSELLCGWRPGKHPSNSQF